MAEVIPRLQLQTEFLNHGFQEIDFRNTLTKQGPGVWSASIFTQQFCDAMIAAVEAIVRDEPKSSSMLSAMGLHLLQRGFRPLFEEFARQFALRFVNPVHPAARVELRDAFVVKYTEGSGGHEAHEDSSGITINLCLGKTFTGGTLCVAKDPMNLRRVMARIRTGSEITKVPFDGCLLPDALFNTVAHKVSHCIIHDGRHMHGARPVTSGERMNLLIWLSVSHPFDPFTQLPVELQSHILSFLDVSDLLSMSQVSRGMLALVDDAQPLWEALWKPLASKLEVPKFHMRQEFIRLRAATVTSRQSFVNAYGELSRILRSQMTNEVRLGKLSVKSVRTIEPKSSDEVALGDSICQLEHLNPHHVPDNRLFPPCETAVSEDTIRKMLTAYYDEEFTQRELQKAAGK